MMTFEVRPQAQLTFVGAGGKPVLVIDLDKRKITVPEGVEVSEAAAAVFEALKPYLSGHDP